MSNIPDPLGAEAQFAVINVKLDILLAQKIDHEARIRVLEKFRWQLAGACVVVSTLGGVIAQHLF